MAETTTETTTHSEPGEVWKPWLDRLSASRQRREDRIAEWQENVERRTSYQTRATDHYDRIAVNRGQSVPVNKDWPLSKAKAAQLYSQTPEVRLESRWPEFEQAVPLFAKELNDTITDIDVGGTVAEVIMDVVNASGIGAVLVSCEKREVLKDMPEGPTPDLLDIQYLAERISPADLLVPSDFTGSNYDKARWLGHDGRMTWAQAVSELRPDQVNRGLTQADKEVVLKQDKRRRGNTQNTLNTDTTKFRDTDVVHFTELFYWRHFYHADETNFKALQRLVFVDGLEEPVINEPYRAQRREGDRIVGVVKNPIRVLTLTYISDESLPPSDSSASRFAIEELEESRNDMRLQRKHSVPMRWGDTNRISANTRQNLERGEFQSFIWTNGPGDRAIGEVSRATFPPEKFEFDRVINNDLTEIWQVGTNQAGAFASGERSAREAGIVERNFQRRVGQEQDKVSKFFLGIAEVLAGHLAIYGTTSQPDELGEQRYLLANAFTYSIRPDSTVRLDAEEQIERLMKGLNLTAQSGYVNSKPVIRKIWTLLGENPDEIVVDPKPKAPEPVKLSFSNAADLTSPLAVAYTMATGQGPTPEHLQAAIQLLQEASAAVLAGQAPPLAPPEPHAAPGGEVETPDIANSGWESAPRVERRAEDGGA